MSSGTGYKYAQNTDVQIKETTATNTLEIHASYKYIAK